jgi:hypothetical protein
MQPVDVHYPGVPISGMSVDDVRRLADLGILSRSPDGVSFVGPGFVSLNRRLSVVLPRPYRGMEHPGSVYAAAHLLMASLRRYQGRKQRAVQRDDAPLLSFGEYTNAGPLARLASALELLAEDAAFGPFVLSTAQDSPAGRVNWGRTLRVGAPVGGVQGEVFTSVVARRVRPDASHPVCIAHRDTLEAARRLLGSGEDSGPLALRVLETLDRHENTLFSDRARRLCRLMRRFHVGESAAATGNPQGVALFFARSFEHVWEEMLETALGPCHPRELPGGVYTGSNPGTKGAAGRPGAHLITDLVLVEGRNLYVLDAKDYAPERYPGTADISKQILYRLLHTSLFDPSSAYALDRTFSAFLFPACVAGPFGATSRLTHRLTGDASGWGEIAGVDVDFARVARAYVNGRADPLLRSEVLGCIHAVRPG